MLMRHGSRWILCAGLSLATVVVGPHVDANLPREPQDFSRITAQLAKATNAPSKHVCHDRSEKCAVYIDVPVFCNTTNARDSQCPVVIALHNAGGFATDFVDTLGPYCHAHKVVCVYPQSEEYVGNGTHWNDGNTWGNRCVWRQWEHCTVDPNEGKFFAAIIKELHAHHFKGPLFAYGFREGGAQALRLGANAGSYPHTLPFAGIAVGAAQLLSAPDRSGPGPYNYNRPLYGKPICYFGLHGEQEQMVGGGKLLDQPSGADFVLMSYNESNHFFARHNQCTNKSSEGPVSAVWWTPASGWDKSAASDRLRAFWQWGWSLAAKVTESRRRHQTRFADTPAALEEGWQMTNASLTVWQCPPGGKVEHLIISDMTKELPWLLRIGEQAYFERVLQFFKQCAEERLPPGTSAGQMNTPAPALTSILPRTQMARKHVMLQVEASGIQRRNR